MRRRKKLQAGPAPIAATLPPSDERPGLVKRARHWLMLRSVGRLLQHPAAAPVVAVVVGGVFAAIALGVIVGVVVSQAFRDGGGVDL